MHRKLLFAKQKSELSERKRGEDTLQKEHFWWAAASWCLRSAPSQGAVGGQPQQRLLRVLGKELATIQIRKEIMWQWGLILITVLSSKAQLWNAFLRGWRRIHVGSLLWKWRFQGLGSNRFLSWILTLQCLNRNHQDFHITLQFVKMWLGALRAPRSN